MFFLIHDFGSCNDGDHSNGFQQFDTKEEALTEKSRLMAYRTDAESDDFILIEGLAVDVP